MPTGEAAFITDANENTVKITQRGHLNMSEAYNLIKNPSRIQVTSNSGGTEFPTVDVGKMIIRSESGNHLMFIGGQAEDAPYSGRGLDFWGGESITMPVTNMNIVRIFATVSGELISSLGFGTADNVALPTNDPTRDITNPSILTVYPTSGASGVALDTIISATFDEAIAESSITTSGFTVRLSGSSTDISGIVYRDTSDPNTIEMSPYSGQLDIGKIYVPRVATSITDLAGNPLQVSGVWRFTTASGTPGADTTRPVVSGHSPLSGATSVAITVSPTFSFSEQMLSGKINSTFFKINLSGVSLSASVTLSAVDKKTVTIDPATDLNRGTNYQISALSGSQDLAGNNMNTPVTTNFTTVEPTLTIVYNVTHNQAAILAASGTNARSRVGIKVENSSSSIHDTTPKKIRVSMYKTGSPTGTIFIRIRDASDNIEVTLGTKDASTLTTSVANYDFLNVDANYTLDSDDRILVEYSGGDASNYVNVMKNDTDVTDGSNTVYTRMAAGSSTYNDDQDDDFAAIIWE